GTLRIRKKGSAGSHNGMKSVIYQLQDDNFPRIRVGIGAAGGVDWKNFVIGGVSKSEASLLAEAIKKAADAIDCIIEEDIDMAMNKFNEKKKKKTVDEEK
ncbi:MAG: aminoacyl-tRNA hydrolase, partial [Bacillota bacterium]|nr:aminoacyl-tRNA hydrolase [Bacillota bacterium]